MRISNIPLDVKKDFLKAAAAFSAGLALYAYGAFNYEAGENQILTLGVEMGLGLAGMLTGAILCRDGVHKINEAASSDPSAEHSL